MLLISIYHFTANKELLRRCFNSLVDQTSSIKVHEYSMYYFKNICTVITYFKCFAIWAFWEFLGKQQHRGHFKTYQYNCFLLTITRLLQFFLSELVKTGSDHETLYCYCNANDTALRKHNQSGKLPPVVTKIK